MHDGADPLATDDPADIFRISQREDDCLLGTRDIIQYEYQEEAESEEDQEQREAKAYYMWKQKQKTGGSK